VFKAVDEFVRMSEITRSVKVVLNVLLQPFLSTSHIVALAVIVSNILLRMRSNGYLGTFG